MKRILIYALEADSRAQARLDALHADSRQAGRRNAELWEGNVEPAKAVIVFPNPNAGAIAVAYQTAGIEVEMIHDENQVTQQPQSVKADEGQNDQTEKGRKGRVK